MKILPALALLGSLAPAPAAQPTPAPQASPAQWLSELLGPEGLELLQEKGILILHGKDSQRLQHVHWKGLGDLASRAQAALSLVDAARRFQEGKPIAPPGPAPFLALAELPPSGLVTPALHSLIMALSAIHDHEEALGEGQLPAQPLLYETLWGQGFAAQTSAPLEDPTPLVLPFFEDLLAGLRPEPEAIRHLAAYAEARFKTDLRLVLIEDAKKGAPSEELSAWIKKYLAEQRRLLAIRRLREALWSLERRTRASADLSRLERVARAFKERPALVEDLRALMARVQEPAGARLSSIGLHLQQSPWARHEMGDTLEFSAAYGLDGLPERRTGQVRETSFLEYPEGLAEVRTKTARRANGWPYSLAGRATLRDSRGFSLGSIVSAAEGNTVVERATVAVAGAFEGALRRLAEAERESLSCRFPEAEASYESLEGSIGEGARAKPQYRGLLKASRRGRAQAAKNSASLARLEEAMAQAREDSSPELCLYQSRRAESALRLLKNLPAGCGKRFPELAQRLAVISRRTADQEAFSRLAAESRKAAQACSFGPALELAGEALAILEADPGARCGATEAAARELEGEAMELAAGELWRAEFASRLKAAQASPEERLKILNPLIARISSLSLSSCFSKEREQAEAMALAAGEALPPPETATALKLLPAEELARVQGEISLERRRLEEAHATMLSKGSEEESPHLAPQPAPPPPPPPPQPEVKPVPPPATEAKAPTPKTKAGARGKPRKKP